MSIEQIEKTLRQSPAVKTPAGLLEKLKADITLPRARVETAERDSIWFGLRRWLPGFATATIILACIIAIGVQARVLSELRQQRKQLEATVAEKLQFAEAVRAKQERARIETQTLELLRRDNTELEKLRVEVAELREHTQQLPALRAEHQRLAAAAKAMETRMEHGREDAWAEALDKAQRVNCVNNLKQFCLGARIWANRHNDILPQDIPTMSKMLGSPKVTVCPADTNRPVAASWPEFTGSSYTILSPSVPESRPDIVYVSCPIHNNVGMVDGSVQQLGREREVARDESGQWIIRRRP